MMTSLQMKGETREFSFLVSQCDFPISACTCMMRALRPTHPCLLNHVVGVLVIYVSGLLARGSLVAGYALFGFLFCDSILGALAKKVSPQFIPVV